MTICIVVNCSCWPNKSFLSFLVLRVQVRAHLFPHDRIVLLSPTQEEIPCKVYITKITIEISENRASFICPRSYTKHADL